MREKGPSALSDEELVAVIQGAPVTTMDVGIVHSQSPENVSRPLAFSKSVDGQ